LSSVEQPGFWSGKRVLVTGGAGFIGSRVVEALRRRGVTNERIVVPRSADCDLRKQDNCKRAAQGCHIVIHLAAPTGGIAFSRAHPASQYRDCMLINLHLLQAAHDERVEKFVALGNLLAYPAAAPSPLVENSLYEGRVASSHLGIGMAKRDLVALGDMYQQEFGMNVINVLAANAYGPGDRFDPARAHVIPATIAKCFREDELVVWGDGSPTRDFLYVDDLAEGILLAAERMTRPGFLNLASGSEVSIRDLVTTIARIAGYSGVILFDASKGGGDPRRVADTARAQELIGFVPRIPLEQGLRNTIDWYRDARTRGLVQ
jgi:GDP-L-fucose synthase